MPRRSQHSFCYARWSSRLNESRISLRRIYTSLKLHMDLLLKYQPSVQITNRNPYIIDGLPNKTSFPQTRDSVHAWAGAGPNVPWRQQQWLWVLKGRQSGQQQQWLPGSCGRRMPWAPTRWPPSNAHHACPALAAPTQENMVCKMPETHSYMTIIRNTIKRTTLKRIADTFVITGLLED